MLQDCSPSIYGRYVDDIFIRVKDMEEILDLKQRLTSSSGLNFTFEESIEGRLPFLDVLGTARDSGVACEGEPLCKSVPTVLRMRGRRVCCQTYNSFF